MLRDGEAELKSEKARLLKLNKDLQEKSKIIRCMDELIIQLNQEKKTMAVHIKSCQEGHEFPGKLPEYQNKSQACGQRNIHSNLN